MSARLFALQNCTLSQRMRKCLWVSVYSWQSWYIPRLLSWEYVKRLCTSKICFRLNGFPNHYKDSNLLQCPHFGEEAKPPSSTSA